MNRKEDFMKSSHGILYSVTTQFPHFINETSCYKNITQLESDSEGITKDYKITISVLVIAVILFTSFGNLITVVAVKVDRRLRCVLQKTSFNIFFISIPTGELAEPIPRVSQNTPRDVTWMSANGTYTGDT